MILPFETGIIPGKERDTRWQSYPHHILYPASAIGGMNYRQGVSHGRAKKYVKGNKLPDSGTGKTTGNRLPKTRERITGKASVPDGSSHQ